MGWLESRVQEAEKADSGASASYPPLGASLTADLLSGKTADNISTKSRRFLGNPKPAKSFDNAHDAVRHRRHVFREVMAEFALETAELEPILTDLMRYDHMDLVSEAIGLLVRHFEQRKVLVQAGSKTFLAVKEQMVDMIGIFNELLHKLDSLTRRRRLYDHELYQASRLLSQLCAYCFSEPDEADGRSAALGSYRSGRSMSRRTSGRTVAVLDADHTKGCSLELAARACCTWLHIRGRGGRSSRRAPITRRRRYPRAPPAGRQLPVARPLLSPRLAVLIYAEPPLQHHAVRTPQQRPASST